jgi:hypothetical protein
LMWTRPVTALTSRAAASRFVRSHEANASAKTRRSPRPKAFERAGPYERPDEGPGIDSS